MRAWLLNGTSAAINVAMRSSRVLVATSVLLAVSTSAFATPHLEEVDDERPRGSVARVAKAELPPPILDAELAAPARDDLSRDPVQPEERKPTHRGKIISAAGTAGIYAALYGWLTAAWWVRTNDSGNFQTHDEGWFGAKTYAGGADKLGHGWGNYAMTRGVAEILHYGGWNKTGSAFVAGGLSLAFFTFSEVKDGYKKEYGFSYGDMISNTAGAALGVVMEMAPALDKRFDVRVSYKPSKLYLDRLKSDGPFNTPEDYTGQTYLLAYHLGSIDYLREHASWTRFFDVNVGYAAVNYKPIPVDDAVAQQELFIGGSINLQAVVDSYMGGGAGKGALHFVTEVFQPPYTTLRAGQLDRAGERVPEGPTARAVPMNN